jgi:hypothetical protein
MHPKKIQVTSKTSQSCPDLPRCPQYSKSIEISSIKAPIPQVYSQSTTTSTLSTPRQEGHIDTIDSAGCTTETTPIVTMMRVVLVPAFQRTELSHSWIGLRLTIATLNNHLKQPSPTTSCSDRCFFVNNKYAFTTNLLLSYALLPPGAQDADVVSSSTCTNSDVFPNVSFPLR